MHITDIIVYPFLVVGIYFEAFILLTLLSTPARERRAREAGAHTPSVAMIVPCFNEGRTIEGTVQSLLALDYPTDKLSIVLVNDGSTDNTAEVMRQYVGHPQITVINQKNAGKHVALNAGIDAAKDAEFVGCLDADSFVERSALREIIPCFDEPTVAAATSAMSVHEPKSIMERMQNAEYILGIALRHALSAVNGIYVTPGPFSLYRRSVIAKLGGFRHGHQTEDMEMALRMQRAGYEIENAPRARVFTKVPKTPLRLIRQRTRWTSGFLRNVLGEYRDLVGNPQYGVLGLFVLPLGFVAVIGGMLLFALALFEFVHGLVDAYFITHGVPLSYTLIPRITSEWLYLPVTALILLALIAIIGSIAFIVVGRRVSRTQAHLGIGILAYLFVYGMIAPFWLFKAFSDILTGTHRSWR